LQKSLGWVYMLELSFFSLIETEGANCLPFNLYIAKMLKLTLSPLSILSQHTMRGGATSRLWINKIVNSEVLNLLG
jgi:hypothetical protein